MTTLSDSQALDALAEALLPRLVVRGVALGSTAPLTPYSADYDDATCAHFLNPDHLGDNVLIRARTFFSLLDQEGEVSSPDLVVALGVKGARSVPANLTNPLKKGARRMKLPVPWTETTTADGLRTIWRDRAGISARMNQAIQRELESRGLA